MKNNQNINLSYEDAYAELEAILKAIQDQVVGIDQLTTQITRANVLINYCKEKLLETEKEINQLNKLS